MTILKQSFPRLGGERFIPEQGEAAKVAIRPDDRIALAGLELSLISTLEEFDRLEQDWNALFAQAGQSQQVFQTFNWNWHWSRAFPARLAIVTGRRDGRLVMVWPLVIGRSAGLRELAWMGEPVSQYGDVLIEDGPFRLSMLREGWAFITRTLRPDVVRLNKTRADAAVAPLLGEIGALSTQQMQAPYLDLSQAPTYEAYAERYSSKARKNRRRQLRRLEESASLEFVELQEGPEAVRIVSEAIRLKLLWLESKGLVSPALKDARTAAFFASAAHSADRSTGMRVSAMLAGGQLAAIEVGFVCGSRIAVHILVYDLAFDKSGPGALLLEHTIAKRLEGGLRIYDLMAPGDNYKKDWADCATQVDDFAVPVTALGRLYAKGYLGFARPRLKKFVQKVPLSLRQALSGKLASALVIAG